MSNDKPNHNSSTERYTNMSSEGLGDIKRVCEALKNVYVDFKQYHLTFIDKAYYSKLHLGFSNEAWVKLLQNYICNRTELHVDTGNPNGEPYFAMN